MQWVHHRVSRRRHMRVNASCLRAPPTARWWQAVMQWVHHRVSRRRHMRVNASCLRAPPTARWWQAVMQWVHHRVPRRRHMRVNASCLRAPPTARWWQAVMQWVHHRVPRRRYMKVNASCLRASPTARWWQAAAGKGQLGERGFLAAHVEERADYDGVAVKWGLGNKAASAQACSQACLDHVPAADVPGKLNPCTQACHCFCCGSGAGSFLHICACAPLCMFCWRAGMRLAGVRSQQLWHSVSPSLSKQDCVACPWCHSHGHCCGGQAALMCAEGQHE